MERGREVDRERRREYHFILIILSINYIESVKN